MDEMVDLQIVNEVFEIMNYETLDDEIEVELIDDHELTGMEVEV